MKQNNFYVYICERLTPSQVCKTYKKAEKFARGAIVGKQYAKIIGPNNFFKRIDSACHIKHSFVKHPFIKKHKICARCGAIKP